MKTRIIIAILMLSSVIGYSQGGTNGGVITGKSKTGRSHDVGVDSTAPNRFPLFVKDSTLNALFAAKDSTKDRKWISIDNFPTTYAATQSGTWNITNVSGTVSLPTGAATSANQATAQSSLTLIESPVNTNGNATSTKGELIMGSDGTNSRHVKTNTAGNIETKAWSVDSTNLAGINSKLAGTLTVGSHAVTNAGTFAVQVDSSLQRSTVKVDSSQQRKGVVIIGGSITAVAGATAIYDSTWTVVNMDTAGLAARASSATVGWQSDSVGLRQHKATDVEIGIRLSMANTTPANDKAVYVYIAGWWIGNSSTWYSSSGGTTTQLSGANSAYTIATPNNLRLLGVLSYTTQNMVLQDVFTLSSIFPRMPDAFSIVIVNFSGAAIHTSGNEITYNLMNKVQR